MFDHHRLFLHRMHAACALHPKYHRHLLAALDHEMALVSQSTDPPAYRQQSNELLEFARAALLDRAANELASSLVHDDPWSAAAAGIEYLHVVDARNHTDLYTQLRVARQKGQPYREAASNISTGFARMSLALLHVHTQTFELEEAHAHAAQGFQLVAQSDPAFQPASYLRLPRYRRRIPWAGGIPDDWLADFWDDTPSSAPPIPADPSPVLEEAENKWRAGLRISAEAWPDTAPWPCPERYGMLQQAEEHLLRESQWPDSVLARHWLNVVGELEDARTSTAAAAISLHHQQRLAMDALWNQLLLFSLLAPLLAAARYGLLQGDIDLEGVHKAAAAVENLLGLSAVDLLRVPRVRHFLRMNLYTRLDNPNGLEGFGAHLGEGGFELVRHVLAWRDVGADVEDPESALRNLLESVLQPVEIPPRPRPIEYWSRRYLLLQPVA